MNLSDVKFEVNEHLVKALELDQMMREYFYEGRKIIFRRGNMKENHNAVVLGSGFCNGRAWIYVRNAFTGAKREITLRDVQ